MHVGDLFDGGDFACTNRPNRLVGNGDVFGVQTLQDGKLVGNDFVFFTGFAFFQAFADAQQWNQADVEDVFHFTTLDFVFLAEIKAALGVADEDDVGTDIGKHFGGHFAGVRAVIRETAHVLRTGQDAVVQNNLHGVVQLQQINGRSGQAD